MIKYDLKNFIKGWFIGNFNPTINNTEEFEIAIKRYKKGDYDESHMHKISTEYTVIIDGEVKMNDNIYKKDDIIIIEKGEFTDFKVLSDECTTCVIKVPFSKDDKYLKNNI